MAKEQQSAGERARMARVIGAVCAAAMLGAAAWLVWKHGVGMLIALDAERTLTLETYLAIHAVALFAAAQPARSLSRPLSTRSALVASGRASINVIAAAFLAIDGALVWSTVSSIDGPTWVLAFLVPALATLWLGLSSFGVAPEGPEDVSDEDLAEAALILTESQRRWSWNAIFAMAGYMAFTRGAILAAYLVCVAVGISLFAWLDTAFFAKTTLGTDSLRDAAAETLRLALGILTQAWTWTVFFLVAVAPPLFVLSAAAWYRLQVRRDRARLRALSQSPAARLMTRHEMSLLRREVERPLAAKANPQRAVS